MADKYAHRKATARIRFTDGNGAPLKDTDVNVKLKNHKFLFGVGHDFDALRADNLQA